MYIIVFIHYINQNNILLNCPIDTIYNNISQNQSKLYSYCDLLQNININ